MKSENEGPFDKKMLKNLKMAIGEHKASVGPSEYRALCDSTDHLFMKLALALAKQGLPAISGRESTCWERAWAGQKGLHDGAGGQC